MNVFIVSIENMHKYGDILPSMLRLRHKEFKERQSYDIPTFKDMEYDAYDTPATVYIVWRDYDGIVRGCSRMAPTDRAYMIKDLWPNMITNIPLPAQDDIWESSRFAIDSDLPAGMRGRVKLEILQAKIEYSLFLGIKGMVGVMPPLIWRAVFVNSGWPIDNIGPVTILPSGEKVMAGWINVNPHILESIKNKTGINYSLLRSDPVLHRTVVNNEYLEVMKLNKKLEEVA